MIDVHGVGVRIGRAELLRDVSLRVGPGEWVALVGPNGAGKSTLLRAVAGLTAAEGRIQVASHDTASLPSRARARMVAMVMQDPIVPLGMRVLDYVLLGRTPHIPLFGLESAHDHDVAASVLRQLGLDPLAHRAIETLSGGERQRVLLARALAQEAPVLLLDEPTTALDVGRSQAVLELVDELRRAHDLTVLSALHDLTLAAQFADRIALLCDGSLIGVGPPREVLTAERLGRVFGAEVDVRLGPDGLLGIVPIRRRKRARPAG